MPTIETPCRNCEGTGHLDPDDPCHICHGTGKLYQRKLAWETLDGTFCVDPAGVHHEVDGGGASRCAVPGGWLIKYDHRVVYGEGAGLIFLPDPDHTWEP